MNANTFLCPCCNLNISHLKTASHLPACVRKFCIEEMGVLPNCTCNACKGLKTHHGDSFVQTITPPSLPSSSSSSSTTSSIQTHRITIEEDVNSDSEIIGPEVGFSRYQAEGKKCIICDGTRTASQLNVPLVYIGKHRIFKICKKEHIVSKKELEKLVSIFAQEHMIIKKNGDKALNPLRTSGEIIMEDNSIKQVCCGFIDEECKKECKKEKDCYFSIYEVDNSLKVKKYFCKSTHLVRYLTEYYCKRGGKTWECFSAEQNRKSRKNSNPTTTSSQSNQNKRKRRIEIDESLEGESVASTQN